MPENHCEILLVEQGSVYTMGRVYRRQHSEKLSKSCLIDIRWKNRPIRGVCLFLGSYWITGERLDRKMRQLALEHISQPSYRNIRNDTAVKSRQEEETKLLKRRPSSMPFCERERLLWRKTEWIERIC